jgi:hypothetical protein
MAGRLFRRGGTATDHGIFTGAAKELTIDETNWRVRVHDGSTVGGHPAAKLSDLNPLGVNATADTTNKLVVRSNAALFTALYAADGGYGDMQVKVNREAIGDTGSFLFQRNYSGRAEIGNIGDDDFRFKVSPDGSTFSTGIRLYSGLGARAGVRDAMRRSYAEWQPVAAATTISSFALATAVDGAVSGATHTSANILTSSKRTIFTSAAAAGAAAGTRGTGRFLWRGNATGLGGFYLVFRGGIETFQSGQRFFMGLLGFTSVIGNVDPSMLTDMIGVGIDAGQTTLRLFRNDAAGTATAIDLGANFPMTGSQDLYELALACEPNGSNIAYRVERLNDGSVATGTLSTDLPTNTVFLAPHLNVNTAAGTSAVAVSLVSMYCESMQLFGSRGDA